MTKHENNFAYAITDKRIIMAQQKVLGQTLQSVALDGVNDVTLNIGMMLGVITIDTIKEKFNVAVNKNHARNINERIHETLLSLRENSKPHVQQNSQADEILKFKNLLDNGIITQEEFDAKKKQLLGL